MDSVGLTPGSVFGRFRIEALLGRGGMGEVYLAEQTTLRRRVALKLLLSELSEDSAFRERFVRDPAENLNGYAVIAARRGLPVVSARLIGAAQAGHEASSSPALPYEAAALETIYSAGVDEIGEQALAAEVGHGRTMTLEKATSFAFDALGVPPGGDAVRAVGSLG